jgi:hypothetical protein
MKTAVKISGLIGSILIAIGLPFKAMHWPGAGIFILLGALLLAIYSLIYMFDRINNVNQSLEKAFIVFFGITGILMCLGFMFKVQHWPGAGWLLYGFCASYAIVVILSIFRMIYEKNNELKYKYTNNLIWILGGILILIFPLIFNIFN